MVRRSGSYLIVGQYTDGGNTWFNRHQIVYRQLDIIGSWGSPVPTSTSTSACCLALTKRFDLRSLVTTFPLSGVGDALRQVGDGAVMKAVLTA